MSFDFDLLIRNGAVLDGAGTPARIADVGVASGVISALGSIPAEARAGTTVDARGLTVAPGFIDIHTHADIALLARPAHLPKIMQGVTTEVFTNCGLGFAPVTEDGLRVQRKFLAGLFGDDGRSAESTLSSCAPHADWNWRSVADLLARYEGQGIGSNVVYLIPHGAVRVSVMGMVERTATPGEVAQMEALVMQGMEQGGWGLSTGLWYAPMRSADRSELARLCRIAGFFATHQRDYTAALFAATEESIAIAREADVPVQISHLQMNGAANAGRAPELLALLERAHRSGTDVTCDTYPYTAGSTLLQALLPSWATQDGPEGLLRTLADPGERARLIATIGGVETEGAADSDDWSRYTLVGAMSPAGVPCDGLPFDRIAAGRGLSVPEWICVALEEESLRACFVHHGAHEGNVRDILQWPHQMIGSDGLHLSGTTHPRLYGTFPRVLGRYVREEKVITLEQAVHKMTGLPAARLGLKQRGVLKTGYSADIVVFDPETVRDTATFEDPLRYPDGIPYVFVNGVAAKEDGQPTGALAGKVLRGPGRAR